MGVGLRRSVGRSPFQRAAARDRSNREPPATIRSRPKPEGLPIQDDRALIAESGSRGRTVPRSSTCTGRSHSASRRHRGAQSGKRTSAHRQLYPRPFPAHLAACSEACPGQWPAASPSRGLTVRIGWGAWSDGCVAGTEDPPGPGSRPPRKGRRDPGRRGSGRRVAPARTSLVLATKLGEVLAVRVSR